MIIIGEKINGTRKDVATAIHDRDAGFIRKLAETQADGGCAYLDANAGTAPEREPDDMMWLVDNIQQVCELPICLDSANAAALEAGLSVAKKLPILNSVSGEQARIDNVLPLALKHKTHLILLALDDNGIPDSVAGRMKIIHKLVKLSMDGGLEAEQLYIDPLVTAISTDQGNAMLTFDTIKAIKTELPNVHVTGGASNISFGMPLRPLINRYFMAMAIQ
ncbi:MAG: dihydropteroate synthase, partial [Desulfatitalea sp.]|nr:dihydropteroate synthase [Desulfatitalea sp.]NNK00250.1 dihydropteroate synthase [Desulfatitalea sp.]